MLAYTFYETDNRVMRYAQTLVKAGNQVDIIALRTDGQSTYDCLKGVNVYRIQKRIHDERGALSYLLKFVKFFFRSAFLLTRMHVKRPYHLIHVHNVPDFLVFSAFIPKLLGAKIILDIHDILPEFYASKFNSDSKGMLFKLLIAVEKAAVGFSNHVIVSNHIWQEKLINRSVRKEKCSVILNYPDDSIFFRRSKKNQNKKVIVVYPGSLNSHQGVDIAIRAFARIRSGQAQAEFHIYGDGPQKPSLVDLIKQLNLEGNVFLKGILPIEEIAGVMAEADIGLVPKRNSAFGGEAFSTKIFEFMRLGVAVMASETKIDRYYFNDSVVQFFRASDEIDLAKCIVQLINDKEKRERLAANASKFIENYTWDKKKHEYLNLIDRLTSSTILKS